MIGEIKNETPLTLLELENLKWRFIGSQKNSNNQIVNEILGTLPSPKYLKSIIEDIDKNGNKFIIIGYFTDPTVTIDDDKLLRN